MSPETRYIHEYEKGILVRKIPYIVDDQTLELEKLHDKAKELKKKPKKDWTEDDIKDLVEYLIKTSQW